MSTDAFSSNIMHFARILRRAGLPIGTGKVIAALHALQRISLTRRDDVYWALHAVFVERHAQTEIFNIAFHRFWQAPKTAPDDLMSMIDPAPSLPRHRQKPQPRRISEAFEDAKAVTQIDPQEQESEVGDAVASWSAAEQLRQQDFETMSAAEWADARRLIAQLKLPIPFVPTRRFKAARRGRRIDMRATMRQMIRTGGGFDLARKSTEVRHPPLVVLCDISGSMASYSRMLLHFVHAMTNDRDRVHTFLFGTRLTNITHALAHRDPDAAISRIGHAVRDWGGGTRIGQVLADFNRLWSRRVLGQGAVVMLITDGLDRDGAHGLADQMARLHRSCRRLIWLNPLLRYSGFEAKSQGIKAMLPHVDEFRPVHNLNTLADVIAALSDGVRTAPRAKPLAA